MSRQDEALITVRITDIVDESRHVRTFTLEPAEAGRGIVYDAGQFLTLRLPVAGAEPIMRTYSISTCPISDRKLAFTVKRAAGGVGSNWLYELAEVGMVLQTHPPAGRFTLDPSDLTVHLYAAGVGITPIIALCKYALTSTSRRVKLHYSSRTRDEATFIGEIARLRERYADRFDPDVRLTNEAGRVEAEEIQRATGRDVEAISYVCGPADYTRMVVDSLVAAGRSRDAIRTESFGPGPRPDSEAMPELDSPSVAVVHLNGEQTRVRWPADMPLIEALDAAGIAAPSSCRQGECLTCECKVQSGNTVMLKNNVLDDEDIDAGYALACQLLPGDPEIVIAFL
ncbi:3-ketosteroid 9alpha-monooxygenase subunit B [Promicromonospora umidemergens]|uniref:Ferredoxin--NADP reductase n=1 Tax=Promicromonospora umidemergens TaxID=629679 RepID=A0ABP8WFE2_9MICO|nr:iron-sulfur cluster-binding domain-containing protein [Promicromonospora umidemergens]MCP2284141.1 3-ketosteroid 9alpha-monooxygenase subunit B [Promicromonospora umidemergens]